ncbi:RNA methyltransferase [Synechococcus sp. HK05]|uniref:TrmH family RNA methyltransferase n=1 Tax=Synechococcus sp. HK05 TaxID=2725975 RepID=UPI001C382E68|nr:RNA methyltransferase [Synechococcus sp. HK05]MBV2351555.1 RNA methyltransferase [Synechococcus sp. HK05]
MELITSRRNPLVGRLRALHQPKGRREQGLLLLEGTHQVQELLRLGLQPEQLLATPAWIERHGALLADQALPLQPVGEEVMEAVATTDHPDGVVATLAREALPVARGDGAFVLALDQLQDPGNLGTLLRTALAAGVDEVWLGGGADPLQPKVLRASAGAALALPLLRLTDRSGLLPLLQRAAAEGRQLAATLVHATAQPYWQLEWTRPTVLLLGNEGAGLHPQLADLATHRVTIPHSAAVESLNVAVAAAPLLLERWRQLHS